MSTNPEFFNSPSESSGGAPTCSARIYVKGSGSGSDIGAQPCPRYATDEELDENSDEFSQPKQNIYLFCPGCGNKSGLDT